jgi:hypothetical protein
MVQLTLVKLREMLREPEAIFWIFAFPVLLALALGIAFRAGGSEVLSVAVQEGPRDAWAVEALEADPRLRAATLDAETARGHLRTGRVALVVVPGEEWTYWYDPTRPEGRRARLVVDHVLQESAGRRSVLPAADREMTEKGSRYIDFLIPGLLGMNLMTTGMWSIGFYAVNARQKRLLKRMLATPMRKSHYLLSQLTGRLVFLVLEVGALVLFARLVFDVPLQRARSDDLRRHGTPRGQPAEDDRGRVGSDERRDDADVDPLRDLLLHLPLPGGDAAVRPGPAVDGDQRRAARGDDRRGGAAGRWRRAGALHGVGRGRVPRRAVPVPLELMPAPGAVSGPEPAGSTARRCRQIRGRSGNPARSPG